MGGSIWSSTTYCTEGNRSDRYCVGMPNKMLGIGSRKLVVKGRVYNSVQEGDKKAVKFHRSLVTSSEETCVIVLEKSKELKNMVTMYLDHRHCKDIVDIIITSPDKVRMDKSSLWLKRKFERKLKEEYVIFEERLGPDFREFVDSKGQVNISDQTPNVDVLKELLHFSYFKSDCKLVMCGFQGVLNGTNFHLSEPTIHSTSGRFGDSDDGEDGIINVFNKHTCTDNCRGWSSPLRETGVLENRFAPNVTPTGPKLKTD